MSPIKDIELNVKAIKKGPIATKHNVMTFLTNLFLKRSDNLKKTTIRILCCKVVTEASYFY